MQLNISERLELIENIWDSSAANPDAVELTEAQRQELDSRLESYKQNLAKGSAWDELKQRIQNS